MWYRCLLCHTASKWIKPIPQLQGPPRGMCKQQSTHLTYTDLTRLSTAPHVEFVPSSVRNCTTSPANANKQTKLCSRTWKSPKKSYTYFSCRIRKTRLPGSPSMCGSPTAPELMILTLRITAIGISWSHPVTVTLTDIISTAFSNSSRNSMR